MFFSWLFNIDGGISDDEPETYKLDLTTGVISSIEIKFNEGCRGCVKARFKLNGSVIHPSGGDGYIVGNAESIISDVSIPLKNNNPNLQLEFSSPNASYDHDIIIRINVVTEEEANAVLSLLERINSALDTDNISEA